MWRVGILYRVQDLLSTVAEDQPDARGLHQAFRLFRGVRLSMVLDVCHTAGWVVTQPDGRLALSQSGRRLVSMPEAALRLREQAATLMDVLRPAWGPAILQGRHAFTRYVPPEVLQCFREAGLLDGSAPDIVAWWDQRAAVYRGARDTMFTEVGREGERLSMAYERLRTRTEPRWIALDYTGSGYDILSRMSGADATPLAIEVKTTTQRWDSAAFFLTRNEWEVLSVQANAVLHLWCVATLPATFAAVSINQLMVHIAVDQGSGRWQSLTCPFDNWTPSVPAQ